MHCSRRQGGVHGRLGRAGISPLLRHSPVRAPPPGDGDEGESVLPLPVPTRGPHEVFLGNWPPDLHELEIAALFHKYSIYPKNIRLHRKPMRDSYAFVELGCAEDVARAVDQLHGGKVLGHQIVVNQSRGTGRQRDDFKPPPDHDFADDVMKDDSTWSEYESPRAPAPPPPPARWRSPSMPPLVLPMPTPVPVVRPYLSERDEDIYNEMLRSKRFCSRGPFGGGGGGHSVDDSADSAAHDMTPDSGSGHQSARSSATHNSVSAASTEPIRQLLRQPVDVLVANFPANSSELELMDLFGRFKPLRVRIMVNDPSQQPGAFTYAYVTVWNTMMADTAVLELDGRLYRGQHLVTEVRRS